MKKVMIALGAFAMISLASCSKEKDCECTTTIDGGNAQTSEQVVEDGDCEDLNQTTETQGVETKIVCEET